MEEYNGTQSNSNNILTASGALDATKNLTELRLTSGQVLLVPTATLLHRAADGFEAEEGAFPSKSEQASQAIVVPLLEEQLEVGRRVIPTGTVTLEKYIEEYHETLNEPLTCWTYDVERVPCDKVVDSVPEPRQEGETIIYPVVQERVVLTKQLVLREELHVTRHATEMLDTQVVTLAREKIAIRREKFTEAIEP